MIVSASRDGPQISGRRPFRTAIEMYREAGEFLLAVTMVIARADHEIRKLRVVQEAHHMTVCYHPQNGVRSLSSYFVNNALARCGADISEREFESVPNRYRARVSYG